MERRDRIGPKRAGTPAYVGLIDDARLVPIEAWHRELGFLPRLAGLGDAALVPLDKVELDAYESDP